MSHEFLAIITIAFTAMGAAYYTKDNKKAAFLYAFSTVFWISTMFLWAVEQASTNAFAIMWVFVVPLSYCIIEFINKNWYTFDDAEERIRKKMRQ